MKDQFEAGQSLDQVLLIIGTSTEAFVVPCMEYMQKVWPKTGQSTLHALEVVLMKGNYGTLGKVTLKKTC